MSIEIRDITKQFARFTALTYQFNRTDGQINLTLGTFRLR